MYMHVYTRPTGHWRYWARPNVISKQRFCATRHSIRPLVVYCSSTHTPSSLSRYRGSAPAGLPLMLLVHLLLLTRLLRSCLLRLLRSQHLSVLMRAGCPRHSVHRLLHNTASSSAHGVLLALNNDLAQMLCRELSDCVRRQCRVLTPI